ncbi:FAD-dependent oxidoreductase [Pararhodobacter zhoushanensis]|uniref:FAD-dependent oxidoreductase n=1 Tax=Pararhodobacter zhoushanensis TaxID=2479545 RepID=UPI000F8EDD8A|nr:FAD-dependent oxidoreductase [Pararhodobacter zhoushanensis]
MIDFSKTYDVVIVGGGPVGTGLAIELGQRGHSVALIERHATLHKVPRGQNLTQRTMEHFQSWGCEAAIRAARTVPQGYAIGGMTSYRTLLSGYHYDWLQRDLVAPYYNAANERLPQYQTEAVLRARAAELPGVDIALGWTARDVAQNAESATVTLTDAQGNPATVAGRYVVGCDGARSAIREAVGIPQTSSEHDKLMVLLVFKSTDLHDHLKRYPGKQFYCVLDRALEGYWLFFGRVDLGTTWFFHAPVPAGTTRENFDFKAYLEQAVGAPIGVEFEHIGFWDLRIALADTYRAGRVFIAGDACHSHPPYGGYGVNTGLEDARNLGWKLSAALEGWAGDALLDSYSAERQPVFKGTAEHFIERFIREDRDFLNAHSPEEQGEAAFRKAWDSRNEGSSEVMSFAPNYQGSPLVTGEPGHPDARGTHQFATRGGHHLAPATLDDGRAVFDTLGRGFTLLALGAPDEATQAFRRAADAAGIPLTLVHQPHAGAAGARYEAPLVLVRPDHYVAWSGTDATDATRILTRAAGHSSEPS